MSTFCCNIIPQINCTDNYSEIYKAAQGIIKERPKLQWLLERKLISVTYAGTMWFTEDGNLINHEGETINNLFKYKIEYRAYTTNTLFAVFN